MKRQQWLVFVPVTLATASLAACASMLGGEAVKIRPVDTMQALMGAPRDALYESAVSAINERDYGRALEYLQAAKAKDPRNVKALNALGVVYDKLGRFDLSARYYAQARAIEPGSKIVAENMGYSSVLQRLLDHNQPIAVASIDLPADLLNPASAAAVTPPAPSATGKTVIAATAGSAVPVISLTEKKVIDASPPTMTAMPLVLPDAKLMVASVILPEPVAPATERKLIDTPPPTMTAIPLVLPDAKHVFASVILPEPVVPVTEKRLIDAPPPTVTAAPLVLPDAKHVFASVILPEPVVPVTEKKLIDAPPPTVTAAPLVLPDAKHVFASVILPEPVAPMTERKLIDAPPPTMTAAPLVLPDAKHVFASVILPEPVVPVTEKKVIDTPPPTVMAAPFMLPDTRPLFTASLSSAVLSPAVVAAPVAPATTSRVVPAMERTAMVRPAPSAVTVPASAKPVATFISVSPAPPKAEAKTLVASTPAVPAIAAPPAKPVVVASSAAPKASAPEKKVAAPHIPAVASSVAPPSAKPAMPARAAKRVAEKPVTVASAPVIASARLRAAVPISSTKQVASTKSAPVKGKVLTIGQPIKLLNASGKAGGAGTVLRRLTTLGWTMRPADSRVQPATVLFYPVQNLAAAKAMQRTLPFPVRLIADSNKAGMRLVIGRDYLSWKPRNSRIATLWQKRGVVASAQKLSLRGVR